MYKVHPKKISRLIMAIMSLYKYQIIMLYTETNIILYANYNLKNFKNIKMFSQEPLPYSPFPPGTPHPGRYLMLTLDGREINVLSYPDSSVRAV